MKTQMAAAFEKAGYSPRQMRLWKPLMEFFDDGGTMDELLVVASALNGRDAAVNRTPTGHALRAAPLPPNEGVGQGRSAANGGHHDVALPSPLANGSGHAVAATKAYSPMPPVIREPSKAQVSAVAQVAKTIAMNAFDRELTRTGQRWGNVYYRELDNMIDDAAVASAVKAHIGALRGDDRYKTIRELMTPREFAILIGKVRK